MTQYKCLRCRHEWIGRLLRSPMACPNCASRVWNKPPADDALINNGAGEEAQANTQAITINEADPGSDEDDFKLHKPTEL